MYNPSQSLFQDQFQSLSKSFSYPSMRDTEYQNISLNMILVKL